jgi:hypothetical protein
VSAQAPTVHVGDERGPVTAREVYGPRVTVERLAVASPSAPLWLVHRTDYHSDGSQTETYYLEISDEQYRRLGGTSLAGASA